MKPNLLRWGAVLGAFPRILHYQRVLGEARTYFERLRVVNEALGSHWVFRLADAVGLETIKTNRPSWYYFYVEDIDRLHCPLDPGAPETEAYLGRTYSDMDMAFYAGMGFDGYRLGLQTQRAVHLVDKHLEFDTRFRFELPEDIRAELDAYDIKRFIPKEDYYAAYGDALIPLYAAIDGIVNGKSDAEAIERTAAGCLILLCGGHRGCGKHINQEERFQAQMESMIIFNHARNILIGQMSLGDSSSPSIRIVA